MRAATAAPDPPLDPPGVCAVFHGFFVGPCSDGSVTPTSPYSGVFVLPTITSPAFRQRCTISASTFGTQRSRRRDPELVGTPAMSASRSFTSIGTPKSGPSGSPRDTSAWAASKSGRITALSGGLRASMRSMAASRRSIGATSPARTSPAMAVASRSSNSGRRTVHPYHGRAPAATASLARRRRARV